MSDNNDGTYKNPVIFGDYSDPDAIRVKDDFYLVSSSFNCIPGLQILHSKDLVNWTIKGKIIDKLPPYDVYAKPRHGCGVWAPSIRYNNGEFYVYFADPDYGIYMSKTDDPFGNWEPLILVKEAKGRIDPCPIWDDDGSVYLVHAWAKSRAGFKNILTLNKMNKEGTKITDEGVIIFDGTITQPTIEGPKFYKKYGYYYIFAPAGGVVNGWQTVLRSRNIYGPYEEKVVLYQGNTGINGPHQGAWIELESGESWFLHFQSRGAYGRIVHLQPMFWMDNWPVIGLDSDNDNKGEPVLKYKKPDVGSSYPIAVPQNSDDFEENELGLQWQWHANHKESWMSLAEKRGCLRLYPYPVFKNFKNFWDVPNLLLQKFCSDFFIVTAKLTFYPYSEDEKAGLIIMGRDYSYLSLNKTDKNKMKLSHVVCIDAESGMIEKEIEEIFLDTDTVCLRVKIMNDEECFFSYSTDDHCFNDLKMGFTAKKGNWIGAKVGLFCINFNKNQKRSGYADFDWFKVE
ncbi:MAG: glycoside hydrolase 43 family protein [Spirochaetes bacterium]|nr:glycoside hydrolase 43 family protein [Spirochaetota bacterium]